jgi:hypothetical protein
LRISALEGKLTNSRISWCECVLKMKKGRVPTNVLNIKIKGKPLRGRPRSRWE